MYFKRINHLDLNTLQFNNQKSKGQNITINKCFSAIYTFISNSGIISFLARFDCIVINNKSVDADNKKLCIPAELFTIHVI